MGVGLVLLVKRKFLLWVLSSDLVTVEGPASPVRGGELTKGKGSAPTSGRASPPSNRSILQGQERMPASD